MESLRELVEAARSGDVEAYGVIVRRFQDMAVGYAYSVLGDFDLAEDAAQESFLEAYRCLENLREPEAFPGWFRRIVFKQCDRLMRGRRVPTVPLERLPEVAARGLNPSEAAQRSELRERVLDAIRALPDSEREVTTLFYINGYSQDEIARFLEKPVSTVKSRLLASRQKLKERMIDMVEDQLKQSRPKQEFADQVLERIKQVRVWLSKGGQWDSVVLLTDEKKRTVPIAIGQMEASSLIPWVSGDSQTKVEDDSIYGALDHVLAACGCRTKELRIRPITVPGQPQAVYGGMLIVHRKRQSEEIDCRPSDGINVAVRAKAPIYVDPKISENMWAKHQDGSPMSPDEAWRKVQGEQVSTEATAPFKNAEELLAEVEKYYPMQMGLSPKTNPMEAKRCMDTRRALSEMLPNVRLVPPLIRDQKNAMETFLAWVEKKKGTELEGLAFGIWGALLLAGPAPQPEQAIPLLERGLQLAPKDSGIVFDLASAYTQAGRLDEALKFMEDHKERLPRSAPTFFGNFEKLWDNPKFEDPFGKPLPDARNRFLIIQIGRSTGPLPTPVPSTADSFPSPLGEKALPVLDAAQRLDLAKRFGRGGFVSVNRVHPIAPLPERPGKVEIFVEGAESNAMEQPISQAENFLMSMAMQENPPRPMTAWLFCDILRRFGINVDGAAITKRTKKGMAGAVAVSAEGWSEVVPVDGFAAIAIALAGNKPLLVRENIAV